MRTLGKIQGKPELTIKQKKKTLFLQKAKATDLQLQIRLLRVEFPREWILRRRLAFSEFSGEMWVATPRVECRRQVSCKTLSTLPSEAPQPPRRTLDACRVVPYWAVTVGRLCQRMGLGFSQIAFLSSSRGLSCKMSIDLPHPWHSGLE